MSTEPSTAPDVPSLSVVRSDHHCFGCGARNPIGLHLSFAVEYDGVRALFVPGPEHQGFDNIVHGGIISTLLDEAMAWATAAAGIWAVTAEMRVRFRHPVHVGERLVVTAQVASERSRLVATSATLIAEADGAEKASATATFMPVDSATATAWRTRYLQEHAQDGRPTPQ
jgi:uncharacterized protein (TIGR00369 family)